jgi:hypothetical protein
MGMTIAGHLRLRLIESELGTANTRLLEGKGINTVDQLCDCDEAQLTGFMTADQIVEVKAGLALVSRTLRE